MDLLTADALPARIEGVEQLEELMTRPTRALVDDLAALEGDILVLGVGGKMGPTLARLAKRAAPDKRDRRRRPVQRAGAAGDGSSSSASRPSPAICWSATRSRDLPRLPT